MIDRMTERYIEWQNDRKNDRKNEWLNDRKNDRQNDRSIEHQDTLFPTWDTLILMLHTMIWDAACFYFQTIKPPPPPTLYNNILNRLLLHMQMGDYGFTS